MDNNNNNGNKNQEKINKKKSGNPLGELIEYKFKSYSNSIEETIKILETDIKMGLNNKQIEERLIKFGLNKLSEKKKESFLHKVWRQLNSILILLLIIAAIISGALQEFAEFALIIIVITINTIIGLYQEGKAEKSSDALKAMLSSKATVVRNGERSQINADQIVPGDIVFVESGDKIPADIRLFDISNLNIDEAMLTGESLPVAKKLNPVDENASLGDRKCMGYSATCVTKGQGFGIAVKTGDYTEIGRIKALVDSVEQEKTLLLVQMEYFGRWIAIVTVPIAIISFLLAYFTGDTAGHWEDAFIIAVAIAVSIIPEGLPAILTIVLSKGMANMAKQNAIVRTLPCAETLGAVNVICSDKTGTLTKNEMTVVALSTGSNPYSVSGIGYDPSNGKVFEGTETKGEPVNEIQMAELQPIISGALLCNDSSIALENYQDKLTKANKERIIPVGDPTEVSLVTFAEKVGIKAATLRKANERLGAVPFESEHKFMCTIHKNINKNESNEYVMYVKGAPDRLIPLCENQISKVSDETEHFDPINKEFWLTECSNYAMKGLRTLAICRAYLPSDANITELTSTIIKSGQYPLTMLGVVAIMDPPKQDAIDAIKIAHTAGIVVKMITGDHPHTALSIGKMIGIVDDAHPGVLTGQDLDKLSEEQLAEKVTSYNIFARTSPENKIQIVQALRRRKLVCSMTGDGVNDAPALRAADIGVAMGITGSDVSKEAAKIVLVDDRFATIVVAVKEGRTIWDNLRKILIFNQPVNFAQGFSILFGLIFLFPYPPLNAIQALYVNMITAVTLGLMLAYEPGEDDIMFRPPRKAHKRLVGKLFLWRIFFVASLLVISVLCSFLWAEHLGYEEPQVLAQTMTTLIVCESMYALSCRFLSLASLHPRVFKGNKVAWLSFALIIVLQVMIVYIPGLNTFFGMGPMDGNQWGIAFLFAFIVFLFVELEKVLNKTLFRKYIRPCMRSIEYTYCCLSCINTVQSGNDITGQKLSVNEIIQKEMEKSKSNLLLVESSNTKTDVPHEPISAGKSELTEEKSKNQLQEV